MRHFNRVHEGLDVAPILAELDAAGDLWNAHRERKDAEGSPHAAMDDIWLRWLPDGASAGDRVAFYPAWRRLPALHGVVWSLMAMARGVELGGLLITRIPAGGVILPHSDAGGWHADLFDTKFYVVLRGGARCVNVFPDGEVNMRPGEIWQFNNRVLHSVENHDAGERISLIVSVRTEA